MLNPLMLLGLLGLSVPIIIHLIQRQRLKPQPLATLQFLDREDVANAFAPVPRDLLQLLLRLLLLALFVFLMARLFVGSSTVGPRAMAVILDQSMSMQRQVAEKESLFDRQKAQVLELIDGLQPEDRLSLTIVGDRVTEQTPYMDDKAALRKVAEGVEVSDSGGLALVPTIRAAVDQLRSRREVNACVLVFSDHQRLNYQTLLSEPSAGAKADAPSNEPTLADVLADSNVSLFLIDDNPPDGINLAIESARFSPERVYVGASSRMTAVVRNRTEKDQTVNLGTADAGGAAGTSATEEKEQDSAGGDEEVGAEATGASGQTREVTLAPGEAAHVDLVARFDSPVDSTVAAMIGADTLPGDNRFHVPMRMKARRRILLVAPPDERSEAEAGGLELGYQGVDLLAYALNPAGYAVGDDAGRSLGTFIDVKRITPPLLERVPLPEYAIIVFHGVTDLPEPERALKDLQAFIANGGSVWLIPQRESSPLAFNQTFGPLLRGFNIGQLKQPEGVQALARGEAQISHPLLLPLLREEWGSVGDIYFGEYFGVESLGSAAVTLRSAGGDPLAAMVTLDRGHVYVQLFDCDLESSSLPRTTAFVPMVQQITATLGQRGEIEPPETIRVGEVLRMRLPELRSLKGDVHIVGPEERKFPLAGPDGEEVRVAGLLKAGAYRVEHPQKKSERRRWLTVNPVLGESDLAAISEEDAATAFGETNVARLKYADLASQFSRRHELTGQLAVLVMLAFAAEALLGAWQSRRGARRDQEAEAGA